MNDLLLQSSTTIDAIKETINWLCKPEPFLTLATLAFVAMLVFYRYWTKPLIAGTIGLVALTGYVASMADPNFLLIVKKADNVPITIMMLGIGFFLWLALRQAALNDRRIERGEPLHEAGADDKVLVWPDLVYVELICLVLCCVVLIVWSILLKAPLEQPANRQTAPNPAKAPWYFLGLQELLVYFDPWIAGVLLPGLIVVGLCAVPYIDMNPKGSGYYTFRERPMAITGFLFGFLILWVVLIVLGTFLRGPNWNFFGPYEYWDVHKPAALVNVQLSELFWISLLGRALPETTVIRELPGIVLLTGYFFGLPVLLRHTLFRKMYAQMGLARFAIFMMLLTWTAIVPIKMVFRWTVNGKYFLNIDEWFFNI